MNQDPRISKISILIVEDVLEMRKLLRTVLNHLGFKHVIEAEDGQEALYLLHKNKVDCIICDWNMPKMNGIELLRNLQGNLEFKYIPFLMVTSENDSEAVLEALQAGVTDYIVKPFPATVLERKILELLN
jgi:two-component system, chemotaxis family, chemotaxis protein CheY